MAQPAARQPTRPRSFRSRPQHSLSPNGPPRNNPTSQSRLPLACRPAPPNPSHGLEAARGRARGTHAYTGPSAWAHHPRALHRAAACRASRAVRPAITSFHTRDPRPPSCPPRRSCPGRGRARRCGCGIGRGGLGLAALWLSPNCKSYPRASHCRLGAQLRPPARRQEMTG